MSIFDLNTAQLKKEIRELTLKVNSRIKSYRESGRSDAFFEKMIERVKLMSTDPVKGKLDKSGNLIPPRGYKGGEIGLGMSYKTKAELRSQMSTLESFIANDSVSDEGKANEDDRKQRAFETFNERYGESKMTMDEYNEFLDLFPSIKDELKGYGYESKGGEWASLLIRSSKTGRIKFSRYVKIAKEMTKGKGASADDIVRTVASLLREDGNLSD